jgi:hypothetical protein
LQVVCHRKLDKLGGNSLTARRHVCGENLRVRETGEPLGHVSHGPLWPYCDCRIVLRAGDRLERGRCRSSYERVGNSVVDTREPECIVRGAVWEKLNLDVHPLGVCDDLMELVWEDDEPSNLTCVDAKMGDSEGVGEGWNLQDK